MSLAKMASIIDLLRIVKLVVQLAVLLLHALLLLLMERRSIALLIL